MYIKNYGSIVIELYPDVAPNTVNNFIYLVKSGFYDNNTFHRLVEDFVLQGGDPTGTGTGDPGYSIKGEFTSNGIENKLKHTERVVSMARGTDKNSAGSQFFIMLGEAQELDGIKILKTEAVSSSLQQYCNHQSWKQWKKSMWIPLLWWALRWLCSCWL